MTAEVIVVNPMTYVILGKIDGIEYEVVNMEKTEKRDKEKS